uniref:Uncharacterized protein n=1 Tax=Opuntia streptacantha TaxID=393608 RepID=A0A7C9AEN7_OPUST
MNHNTPPPSAVAAAANVCRNCHSDDHWILHNVKHRGVFKEICTSCVLKLHPASFCPTCFSLHDPNSLNPIPSSISGAGGGRTLTCFKCSSLSHSTCVPPNVPKSPYLCPPCSNPSFKFFDIRKSSTKSDQNQSDGGDGSKSAAKVPEVGQKVLDERAAKVLLAAARIAAISMNKAAAVARENAERRVRDAALARKRAKEAIEHVMALSARFSGNKRRETAAVEAPPVPVAAKAPNVKLEKNGVAKANNVAAPPPGGVHMVDKNNMNQLKVEY